MPRNTPKYGQLRGIRLKLGRICTRLLAMTRIPTRSKKLDISLFTDRPDDARLIQKTLEHVYPGIEVNTYTEFKDFTATSPSLFIIDTAHASGTRLEHVLDILPDIPTLLTVEDFAEVRKFGDRLTGRRGIVTRNDLSGMGLIQAMHHLLERQQLHEQLQRTSRHLKELKRRDDLTGLFNHRYFNETLSSEVKKSNRYKRPLGLIIVSVKNFSTINKTLGHHEGDRILAKVAQTIRDVVREVDTPARYGDNEFGIVLPESDEAAVAVVASRIHQALGQITNGTEVNIVTCLGVASLGPNLQTKEELLRTALGALAEAKRNGQSAICTSADILSNKEKIRENRQLIEQLHDRLARLSSEAQRSYFQSLLKVVGEVPALKKMLLPHSERVAFFGRRIAESIGQDEEEAIRIYRAGLLHDAGKLAIDPEILAKPDRLSTTEEELMRQHPLFGIQIIGNPPFLTTELDAVLHHHERYDGTGYPDRLAGHDIPLAARILAITEAWDTMTTPQPYRPQPLSFDSALEELTKNAGSQFDPELVERFTSLIAG
jgi:diguanylate cyclase (GGDEF)-like protein